MRLVIPAAAFLLGAAAFLTRGEGAAIPARPACAPKAGPACPPVAESVPSVMPEVAAEVGAAPPSAVRVQSPEPRTVPSTAALLRQRLELNDERARQILEILDERAAAVAAYEAEIRARGWFRLEEFLRRIGEIRELSYRRIAALLDGAQGARFEACRQELAKKDLISISVPEEEVVCLD